MQLTSRLDFAATPAAVHALLTDPSFLEEVCAASHALEHEVSVTGNTTHTSRTLSAPEVAQKFTGPRITIVEDLDWSQAGPGDSRTAQVQLSVPGLPVTMRGTATLAAGGKGTTVDYDADLKVNIPFVGKKLEQSAAPAVLEGIELQQRIGDRRLAQQ